MEREILFKVKRVDNGKWVEGDLFNVKKIVVTTKSNIGIYTEKGSDSFKYEYIEVDPETVCQFTGLTDKNGMKIFENDFDQNYDVVKWCENRIGYSLFTYDHPTKEFIHCNCYCCTGNFELNETLDNFEVIGNIHTT